MAVYSSKTPTKTTESFISYQNTEIHVHVSLSFREREGMLFARLAFLFLKFFFTSKQTNPMAYYKSPNPTHPK